MTGCVGSRLNVSASHPCSLTPCSLHVPGGAQAPAAAVPRLASPQTCRSSVAELSARGISIRVAACISASAFRIAGQPGPAVRHAVTAIAAITWQPLNSLLPRCQRFLYAPRLVQSVSRVCVRLPRHGRETSRERVFPSHKALITTLTGLSPAGHTSLRWTHKCFNPCCHLHEPLWPLPTGTTGVEWDSHPQGRSAFSRRTIRGGYRIFVVVNRREY